MTHIQLTFLSTFLRKVKQFFNIVPVKYETFNHGRMEYYLNINQAPYAIVGL